MNYAELIAALSLEMRLDLVDAGGTQGDGGRERAYTIRFDDEVDVTMDIASDGPEGVPPGRAGSPTDEVVHLHAVLAPPVGDAAARERLFAALLQIHLFGAATDDAYFGFDAGRDRVTLSKAQALCGLDSAQAVRSVASFVDQCLRWNAALPALAASE